MQGSGPRAGKAFGARDRVVEWLAAYGDIREASGMASPKLAEAVGYSGSSIAFAQLLSGMERSGLIEREVRGKRTYRVSLAPAGRERARRLAQSERGGAAGSAPGARPEGGGRAARPAARDHDLSPPGAAEPGHADDLTDYDELARRLLVQVARRLLPAAGEHADAGPEDAPASNQRHLDALEGKVAALEQELVRAKAARMALEAENGDLREQLERIRSNLDQAEARLRPRPQPAPSEPLDQSEIALLQRLLANRPPDQLGKRASSA